MGLRLKPFQPGKNVVTSHSVTNWIEQVKVGESVAAQRLWERYLSKLAQVARSRLAGSPQQVADAEDVVVVAFEKFLRYAQAGRFPRLDDRYDLWQVLLLVTDQVAIDQRRAQSAAKRGGFVTRSLTSAGGNDEASESQWQPAAPEPTPEFVAAASEQCRRLLGLLENDEMRRIAMGKVHGQTNEEIAGQEQLSIRSVERKLNIIRKIWTRELS
jgi:DNA-directed RNA polymerase specialized sigma24 family protein